MTTDQIKDAESAVSAGSGSADPHVAVGRATNEARQIIAKARHDAFRMVTEARTDADAILDEAKFETADRSRATGDDAGVTSENSDLLAVNAVLRVEYNELVDLIDNSRALLEELDSRLLDLATMPDTLPSLDGSIAEVAIDIGAQVAPYVIDYTPAVAPPPKPDSAISTERAESFYTRKSAKLPRLGSEAGRDAIDVVRSMRDRMREQDAN